jgi:peptide chain release factor subunit 3
MADTWEEDAALQPPHSSLAALAVPALNPNSMIFVPGQGMVPAQRPAAPAPAPIPAQPPAPVEEPASQPPQHVEPVPEATVAEQQDDAGSANCCIGALDVGHSVSPFLGSAPEPVAPAPPVPEPEVAPVPTPTPAPAPVVEEPVAPLDESAVMKSFQESLVEEPR